MLVQPKRAERGRERRLGSRARRTPAPRRWRPRSNARLADLRRVGDRVGRGARQIGAQFAKLGPSRRRRYRLNAKLADATRGVCRTLRAEGAGVVRRVVALRDGTVVSAGDDGLGRAWDDSGYGFVPLAGHRGPVFCLIVLPDGRAATAGEDGAVRVWDDLAGRDPDGHRARCLTLKVRGEAPFRIVALAAVGGGRVAAGGITNVVCVWDDVREADSAYGDRVAVLVLRGHEAPVRCLAALPDGRVASGGDDGAIRVWDDVEYVGENSFTKMVRVGAVVLVAHGRVLALAVLEDGRLCSAGGDGLAKVWDGALYELDGKCRPAELAAATAGTADLAGHEGAVSCLCPLPDGRLATAGDDGWLRVWDAPREYAAAAPACVALRGHASPILRRPRRVHAREARGDRPPGRPAARRRLHVGVPRDAEGPRGARHAAPRPPPPPPPPLRLPRLGPPVTTRRRRGRAAARP